MERTVAEQVKTWNDLCSVSSKAIPDMLKCLKAYMGKKVARVDNTLMKKVTDTLNAVCQKYTHDGIQVSYYYTGYCIYAFVQKQDIHHSAYLGMVTKQKLTELGDFKPYNKVDTKHIESVINKVKELKAYVFSKMDDLVKDVPYYFIEAYDLKLKR